MGRLLGLLLQLFAMVTVEAHEAKPHREPAQLTQAECTEHALGEKEVGNAAFKAQDWATAAGRYQEGLRYALYAHGHHGEPLEEETTKVVVTLHSNSAAAYLKQDKPHLAIDACTR